MTSFLVRDETTPAGIAFATTTTTTITPAAVTVATPLFR